MKLLLQRTVFTEKSTIGQLFINDRFECHTLEDRDRFIEDGSDKVKGETAIPRGIYRLTRSFSQRFQKVLPELIDVPQFTGVRIHPGNTDADTEGCILLGEYTEGVDDWISNSRKAFNVFDMKLENMLREHNHITLEVS